MIRPVCSRRTLVNFTMAKSPSALQKDHGHWQPCGQYNEHSHKRVTVAAGSPRAIMPAPGEACSEACYSLAQISRESSPSTAVPWGRATPPFPGSWHPLLVVENKVWPPDIVWGDADFFYTAIVIWIPLQVDVCPLLKREDFSHWEPFPALSGSIFSAS